MTHNFGSFLALLPVVGLSVLMVTMIPYWVIWKKAGFSPWLSLLMLVPLVNLVMLYVLAFSEWRLVPEARQDPWRQY